MASSQEVPGYSIRRAVGAEARQLRPLLQDDLAWSKASVEAPDLLPMVEAGRILVGEKHGQIVALLRIDFLWPESVPLIAWVFVDAQHRGLGLHGMPG